MFAHVELTTTLTHCSQTVTTNWSAVKSLPGLAGYILLLSHKLAFIHQNFFPLFNNDRISQLSGRPWLVKNDKEHYLLER